MGPKAELVVEEDRDEGAHAELHEVGEGWLEVVAISKLESVPPLDSSVKDKASFGSVRLRVVLLPTILTVLSVKWSDQQADLMYSPFRAVLRSLRLSSSKASALEVPPPTDICNSCFKYLL